MKCWNWPRHARLDGAVLGGDDAGGDSLRKGKGAADGFNPIADLRPVGVAHLDGGQGRAGVDLDDGEVGGLVDADDARGTAEVLRIGIGGELDVNLVGLFDDVVVGDDVALGIDDEAGAEGLADLAVVAAVALVGDLAAEEAIEEVLEVVCALALALTLPAGRRPDCSSSPGFWGLGWTRLWGFWRPLTSDCLGRVWVLMLTTAGPTALAILTNSLGWIGGVDDLKGRGIGCCRSFFPVRALRELRTSRRPGRQRAVARIRNVDARRCARRRARRDFIGSKTS